MTLIYKGTMIAMGTPQEMKTKVMKDEVLEVLMPAAEDWVDRVGGVKGVKEAALFSTKIHAVVEDSGAAIPAIEGLFAENKLTDCEVRKIMPSLEDVFVSSIEAYDKEHPAK
jgi:ABC-2 type transport system ATP-binding protein